MAKVKSNLIGAWAFLIGVILAVIVGLLQVVGNEVSIALVILGAVIGLLNVGGEELKDFLLAGTALVVVSALGGGQAYLGLIPYVGDVVNALVILFVPATIIVALKAVFVMARK